MIVIQPALDVTIQAHAAGAVTVTAPGPPSSPND
jgi:hypothetical protein